MMNIRQILVVVFILFFTSLTYSQSKKDSPVYRKFYLSPSVGWSYALGNSNTVLFEDFTLPYIKTGFTPGLDAAWFFTKNYGIGMTYRFYTASTHEIFYSEYTKKVYEYTFYESEEYLFDEKTHIFGPVVYARWPLGKSKFMFSGNTGAVFLHNKLSKLYGSTCILSPEKNLVRTIDDPPLFRSWTCADHTGTTIGFTLSAGIRYQITSLIGMGMYANGLFASLSQMEYYNEQDGKYESLNISRKINRVGFSVAVDFSF